jgi:hypothetical protein
LPAFNKAPIGAPAWWLVIPLVAILGECLAWFDVYLVRNYLLQAYAAETERARR